ncbi:hypothetical protein E8E12_004796 [Didymella heteroderae]|uniref:B30.2/SPRY domain-containing protein n=1 Tax=Didymella heteroderae TaxID=1769908 RepID=A0A9P4WK55_9PLEO|nr:hypothetical protein E8E12_004796 [Didymella heteroderae]
MADDKDAEFAFDLFSDIAPLLALFGDQFARQFTSESLTWVDHLIFAMVPLGTLIVITGAIRVQGPRIAKSFIGRGRESRALAEIELMSSTSGEVFELFNSKSIIRDDGEAQDRPDTGIPSAQETVKSQVVQFQDKVAKARDTLDWTPPHYASFVKEHFSLHKIIGTLGRSPIHMAAISGSRAAMEWVSKCSRGREDRANAFDMVGTDSKSPLHLATKSGNAFWVETIIRKKRIRTTTGNSFWKRSAIHLAASHGHDTIITVLLKEDSQIETADEIGWTPLEYLFEVYGELQGVDDAEDVKEEKELDENSGQSESDSIDRIDSTAEKSTEEAVLEARKELANHEEGFTNLMYAAREGFIDAVRFLVEEYFHKSSEKEVAEGDGSSADAKVGSKRIDVNETGPDDPVGTWGPLSATQWGKYTLLHVAIMNGHIAVVRKLLQDSRVIVGLKNPNNDTAVSMATSRSMTEALRVPLNYPGIDSNARVELMLETCKAGSMVVQEFTPDVLELLADTDINDKDFLELISLSEVSKTLLGPCNRNYPDDEVPGWYRLSWAYHGDDGALFVNTSPDYVPAWSKEPTEDFGSNGEYGYHHSVGVGPNSETGERFITLNGKRRNHGDAFENMRSKGRKMYPCVGVDTTEDGSDLEFMINFGNSKDHPFKYKAFTSKYGSGMHDDKMATRGSTV